MMYHTATILLWYVLFFRFRGGQTATFEFGTTVQEVTVALSEGDDPNEAVTFVYEYLGPMPSQDGSATIEYQIYEAGCSTLYADFTDNNTAMFFNRTVEDPPADNVTIYLGIDLETIADSVLWTSLNATHAELAFCGRFKVEYDGVFVNFHETDLTVTVNKVSESTFESENVSLDMVQAGEVGDISEVSLDYPVQVYHCDANAVEETTPPTQITQGNPVQLCVRLLTSQTGVYVEGIYSMSYWSELYPGIVSTVVSNGIVTNKVTELDCTQVAGVCRIKFIATANIFHDNHQASNSLVVDGEARVALGADTRRRRIQVSTSGGTATSRQRGKSKVFQSHFHLSFRDLCPDKHTFVIVWTISLGNVLFTMSVCSLVVFLHSSDSRNRTTLVTASRESHNLVLLADEDLV